MARNNKHGEQAQEQWNSRVARKRLDLSASVEEALRDDPVQEDPELDETDTPLKPSKGSTLIPPRLSLQSRYLPAVPSQVSPEVSELLPAPAAEEHKGTENTNILSRFAHRLTSSLTSFGGMLQPTAHAEQEESAGLSKLDGAPSAQPAAHSGHNVPATRSPRSQAPHPAEVSAPAQNRHRFAKHNTKVHLQVVPKAEEAPKPEELATPLPAASAASPGLMTVERLEKATGTIIPETRADLSGSGSFESGQSDLTVANANITTASVPLVVLTGDPGPVVVQYVSLQPKVGFTVHLSAPTKNRTPFNYTIL